MLQNELYSTVRPPASHAHKFDRIWQEMCFHLNAFRKCNPWSPEEERRKVPDVVIHTWFKYVDSPQTNEVSSWVSRYEERNRTHLHDRFKTRVSRSSNGLYVTSYMNFSIGVNNVLVFHVKPCQAGLTALISGMLFFFRTLFNGTPPVWHQVSVH